MKTINLQPLAMRIWKPRGFLMKVIALFLCVPLAAIDSLFFWVTVIEQILPIEKLQKENDWWI